MRSMNISDLASFHKALSEPTRIRIVYLLNHEGELCVCDLVSALQLPQSVVSRHLAYLRKLALLTTRKKGVWVYYQLANHSVYVGNMIALLCAQGTEESAGDVSRLLEVKGQACC